MEAKSDVTEPEYVVVCEDENNESDRIELPINDGDSTLGLHTLTRAFPNAHGLKFKNPATGAYRALLADGEKFFKPAGGWQDKLFVVITQHSHVNTSMTSSQQPSLSLTAIKNEPATTPVPVTSSSVDNGGGGGLSAKKSHVKSDQNAKRRKLMVESDDDDKDQSSDSDMATNGQQQDKRLRQAGSSSTKQKRLNDDVDSSSGGGGVAVDEPSQPPKCTDLIVLGLPFKITESEVRKYFETFGGVALVDIKKKDSGTSKGFGFIRMKTFEGQLKVLHRQTHTIANRKCQVRVPYDKNGEVREDPLAGTKVFVGRLQEKTTAADLRKYFADEARKVDENASVIDVYIPKPFRAFAFVTFSSAAVAKKMIKKGDYFIDGSQLSLQSAQPKTSSASQNNGCLTSMGGHHGPNSPAPFARPPYMEDSYYDWYPPANAEVPPRFLGDIYSPMRRVASFATSNGHYNLGGNVPPGRNLPPLNSAGGHHSSQAIASGLETLNLNNMKPEVVTALKAIIEQSGGGAATCGRTETPPVVGGGVASSSAAAYGPYTHPHHHHHRMAPPTLRRGGGSSGGGGTSGSAKSSWR